MNWTFNDKEDGIWDNDFFSTKEEAIAEGIKYAKDENWLELYIGQMTEIPVESPIDADEIIEKTAENIDDNYGGDYEPGEQFLSNIQCGDSAQLQKLLDEAFDKWVKEKNIKCLCFVIENIERVDIKAGE